MRAAVIADDLTGAADTGVQLARAGYRIAVAFQGAPVPPTEDLDAVALDTDSRSMPAGFAAKRVLEAARAIKDARIVYKKIDSTLRGPVAAELAAALEATGRACAIVAPAFPSTGRTTRGGVQLVDGVPVCETAMKHDPSAPVREGHIPTLLAIAFPSVGTLSVEEIGDPERARRALDDSRCVVADAEEDAHLEALVRAVPDPERALWVGSAGLARALGTVYPGPRDGELFARTEPVRKVLVVIGSLNEAARRQLRRLVEERSGAVPVATDQSGAVAEAIKAALAALTGGGCAVVHSAEERHGPEAVVEALAEVVAGVEGAFDALVLTGGDTAVGVARRLGAVGILLEGEVEPGVPTGTLIGAGKPYRVVTKAGGFGEAGTLARVVEMLLKKG